MLLAHQIHKVKELIEEGRRVSSARQVLVGMMVDVCGVCGICRCVGCEKCGDATCSDRSRQTLSQERQVSESSVSMLLV